MAYAYASSADVGELISRSRQSTRGLDELLHAFTVCRHIQFFCMQTLLVRPYSMVVRAAPLTEITVNPRRTWDELEP